MKWFKRIFISIIVLVLLAAGGFYFWLRGSKPQYTGALEINGIEKKVNVYFDDFGIPHIYAENKHDLYLAFGYLHAQDRLFQMEMMRRAGSGRLSEIIGRPTLKVDKLFKTIGLVEYAKESAIYIESQKGTPMHDDISAYLEGINQFISEGKTPPEFSIIGIEKTPFTVEDMFYITGAMSFNFSQAQRTEPVIDFVQRNYGNQYLHDLGIWHDSTESYIRANHQSDLKNTVKEHQAVIEGGVSSLKQKQEITTALANLMIEIESLLPVAPLEGSNAWVLSGKKTKSGKVLFCNDTHIGYMLPQTWYEAHLNAPDFEMYGHFMAGIPFALVGRNQQLSWGLTMLLNDDMDFYYEQESKENRHSFLSDGQYSLAETSKHVIKIKGEADTTIEVIRTKHGPIINQIFDGMNSAQPISMYWTYTELPNKTIDALYGMNNSSDFESFQKNLPKIHGPGLNVNYGDKQGNVAWWGCAALIHRSDSVNSFTILDGTDSSNDPIGFYPFDVNPKCINPEWGYIYSANDWPQAIEVPSANTTIDTIWYPGYYKPQYRADRIRELIEPKNDWDSESIKAVMNDHTSRSDATLMGLWNDELSKVKLFNDSVVFRQYDELFKWSGEYDPMSPSPTFYNKMLYHYLQMTLEDEMGKDLFQIFLQTHHVQRSHTFLYKREQSLWWDNIKTPEKETRKDIIYNAYCATISDLRKQFGDNPNVWNWRKACSLELRHPLGEVAALKPIFSISAKSVYGGNETILQSGFRLDSTGVYKVFYGSQMRIIADFAHSDSTFNVTPSGNSGHVMSAHYSDQAALYREMKFRPQWMSQARVKQYGSLVITGTKN